MDLSEIELKIVKTWERKLNSGKERRKTGNTGLKKIDTRKGKKREREIQRKDCSRTKDKDREKEMQGERLLTLSLPRTHIYAL